MQLKPISVLASIALLCVAVVAWLLLQPPKQTTAVQVDYKATADTIIELGSAALADYSPAAGVTTGDIFSDIYFDVFEESGMEMAIGEQDVETKVELEAYFSEIIAAAMRGAPLSEVQETWTTLRRRLLEVAAGG